MNRWQTPKIILDPVCGPVEIRPVLPMVDTREFQALARKCQLSLTPLVFRSAPHTRFSHSVGSYHGTRVLADRWVKPGYITKEEGDAIAALGLLHDIGHPAFSHVTEDFCPMDHKEMTVIHIQNLKRAVEACGVNHELLLSLARHEHPLWVAVADKNIGMEKLDYLERDGLYTLGRPMGVDAIRNYVYYLDGTMVIDAKVTEDVMRVQEFYMHMYKEVYLRKALVIAQRAFHKMIHYLVVAGELLPSELFAMTDDELMARIIVSQSPSVQALYQIFRERMLFKEVIALRPAAFAGETRIAEKSIHVCQLSEREVHQMVTSPQLQKENHAGLEELEDAIADVAGIPRGKALLVPVFNTGRFKAQDVKVLENGTIRSLREMRPRHFDAMAETAHAHTALRVCALGEFRDHLSSPAVVAKVLPLLFPST